MTVEDDCGLSWLALLSLAALWFGVTFLIVLAALLVFGGSQ